MKHKNRLTVALLEQAIAHQQEFITSQTDPNWKGRNNPQVVAMVQEVKGRLAAYEAVLAAMRGDVVYLNIDAGK